MARPDYQSLPPAVARRARSIRGVGYVFFLAITIYLNAILIVGIWPHLEDGTARDPFTDQQVGAIGAACESWADELKTTRGDEPGADWKIRAWSWKWRCAPWDKGSTPEIKEGLRAK